MLNHFISLGLVVAFTGSLFATPPQDGTKFTSMREEIRQIEREISKRYASMPIGFPERQAAEQKKIEELKARMVDLRSQLDKTAQESFDADPDRNPQAAAHILRMAADAIEGRGRTQPFDPSYAYELASLIGKHKKQDPQVWYVALQASICMQDYERAGRILSRIDSLGIPIHDQFKSNLETAKKFWAKELAKRSLEEQADDLPRVKLETDLGDIVLELFEDEAPQTVANFISLVESGFYDGLGFFEVNPGQVARIGCPNGDGTGDPGYKIQREPSTPESRRFFAGTIGMHESGPNSSGSQFFFTYQPMQHFDMKYVAFGRVIEGLDILFQLKAVKPSTLVENTDAIKINRATVLRKRDHDYQPTKAFSLPSHLDSDFTTDADNDQSQPADAIPDVAPKED